MINLLLVEISSNVQNSCLRGYELAIAHGLIPFKHEIERVIMELGGTLLSVTSPVFEQVASVPDRRYIIFPTTHRVDDEVFDRHIATGHLDVVHFLEMVIKLRGEERDKQRLDVQANETKMSNAVTKLQSQLEEVQARLVTADGARDEYRLNLAAEKASKDKLRQASDSQAKADRHRIAELQTSVDDLSTRLVELGDARSRETQSSNARIDGIREKARIEIDRLNVKIKEMSETHFELAKAKEAAERRAGNPLTAVSRRIVAQESVPPMPEFRPDDRQAASSLSRQNGNEGRSNPIFSLSKPVSISIGSNGHSERPRQLATPGDSSEDEDAPRVIRGRKSSPIVVNDTSDSESDETESASAIDEDDGSAILVPIKPVVRQAQMLVPSASSAHTTVKLSQSAGTAHGTCRTAKSLQLPAAANRKVQQEEFHTDSAINGGQGTWAVVALRWIQTVTVGKRTPRVGQRRTSPALKVTRMQIDTNQTTPVTAPGPWSPLRPQHPQSPRTGR